MNFGEKGKRCESKKKRKDGVTVLNVNVLIDCMVEINSTKNFNTYT